MFCDDSQEPNSSIQPRELIRKTPRWFVGLVLIATGIGKALDIPGFAEVLATYDLLPAWGIVIMAYCLPFFELAVGAALLSGYMLTLAAWGAVVLHAVLLISVAVSLWRGLKIDNCGCFGVFWPRPLGVQTFVEDAVMLGLSLLVLRLVRRQNAQASKLNRSR